MGSAVAEVNDEEVFLKLIAEPLFNTDQPLQGAIRVPGDKSISHRSIMLGSIARGTTEVAGFLQGADAMATLNAFRAMGVSISDPVDGRLSVQGVGLHGLRGAQEPLDMGNSGTSMRLLSGLLAGQRFDSLLMGDESLSKRPMERVARPLRLMGANVSTNEGGLPPVQIGAAETLSGIDYQLPMASAQVKSCVLLAGMYAQGETRVTEPAVTRDHTERMLKGFGYSVDVEGPVASLTGGGELVATQIDVPADISSAAFFMVACSIAKKAEVQLQHVGINPTRTGVIDILRLMGADIELENERVIGGEPIADITVKSASLKGIRVPESLVPLAIDEFPAIFVAAAFAEGETVVTGAEELRVKESDRIQAMVDALKQLGIDATATEDGAVIRGSETDSASAEKVSIECHHDHRIAMASAIASVRSGVAIEIDDCDNIQTSFPNFFELANSLGMRINRVD